MRDHTMSSMRGFSFIGLLIIGVLLVFVVVIGINLTSPYLHHFAVKDALTTLAQNPDVIHMSKAKLNDTLQRKLQVNYITDVSLDSLVVDKKEGKYFLTMKYEVRVPLIANIDAVVKFDEEVPVSENN